MTTAIRARGLTRRFAGVPAVDGLDLDVPSGSIFGFLGQRNATTRDAEPFGEVLVDAVEARTAADEGDLVDLFRRGPTEQVFDRLGCAQQLTDDAVEVGEGACRATVEAHVEQAFCAFQDRKSVV